MHSGECGKPTAVFVPSLEDDIVAQLWKNVFSGNWIFAVSCTACTAKHKFTAVETYSYQFPLFFSNASPRHFGSLKPCSNSVEHAPLPPAALQGTQCCRSFNSKASAYYVSPWDSGEKMSFLGGFRLSASAMEQESGFVRVSLFLEAPSSCSTTQPNTIRPTLAAVTLITTRAAEVVYLPVKAACEGCL